MSTEEVEEYWEWNKNLTPIFGFGFFPEKVNKELDDLTEVPHKSILSKFKSLYFRNFWIR